MSDPIDSTYIGKKVSFNLFAASALGGNIVANKVLAVIPASLVSRTTGEDPAFLHSIVAPVVGVGFPASYKDYNYAVVEAPGGSLRAIGMPWIDGTVTIITTTTITVTIQDKSVSDVNTLKNLLIAGGFTNLSITTA